MTRARDILATCTESALPTLDVAVLGALELFSEITLPEFDIPFNNPLVVGSGNAVPTGRILFHERHAVVTDESSYQQLLTPGHTFDGVVIISSSGGKHAISIAKEVKELGLQCILLTNTAQPPASAYLHPDEIRVYPKNREPYTYNTSTYLGMITAHTKEDPKLLEAHLRTVVEPALLRNFNVYSAFTFIVPTHLSYVRDMYRNKFDELFGPMVVGRMFTVEEIKHAKTIVVSGDELFLSLGCEHMSYGLPKHRLSIPLPEGAGYAAAVAVGYYVIGRIQAALPPYFMQGIKGYVAQASETFGHTIPVIID